MSSNKAPFYSLGSVPEDSDEQLSVSRQKWGEHVSSPGLKGSAASKNPPPDTSSGESDSDYEFSESSQVSSENWESVKRTFDAQLEKIKSERLQLEAERKQLNALKNKIESWCPSSSQRVKLNVSGQRLEFGCSSNVLSNQFMRALLSGAFAPPDIDGFYFIERDPRWTLTVLKFICDKSIDLKGYSQRELGELRAEADFLMVTELVQQCSARIGPYLYSTLLEVPASGNGVVFELLVKHRLQIFYIAFFPYTNSVEEIVVYHSEGGLSGHNALYWHRLFKGKLELKSALLCKIEFAQPLYCHDGRHTISLHCMRNDSAVTYTAKRSVVQPCAHFEFGNQAGLKADPETPHALNARFFVGKILYDIYEE